MDSESDLISLISDLLFLPNYKTWGTSSIRVLTIQILYMAGSIDMNSQPKPESEFMSLTTQAISVFYSMDMDSQPEPLQSLRSYVSQMISHLNFTDSGWIEKWDPNLDDFRFVPCIEGIMTLEPEPELVSIIYQIFSLVTSMKLKSVSFTYLGKLVTKKEGKFIVHEEEDNKGKWNCFPLYWERLELPHTTYFCCKGCNGENHEEYKMASIKHLLHRKHSLQLVFLHEFPNRTLCYCCDNFLGSLFYYCSACNFAISSSCVKIRPVLSVDNPKWHEHTLHLFPRGGSLTCNLCALNDASSPIYMCPNCDFVAHRRCLNLPRLIRISRHHHRISFTPLLDHGDLPCGVCRREIDGDYGGYSCIKKGCSYVAHSKCAIQSNIWDNKELEGEPEEEDTEGIEPFVRISDGIIQHFSHQHHQLKLDENTNRDYDEDKLCQACITPIYFGNFYSCLKNININKIKKKNKKKKEKRCEFILHEECANLSRKIYHPIHPHLLTLEYDNVVEENGDTGYCSACSMYCSDRFYYKCNKVDCWFKLHVQCATVSEPLVHESHIHPLFLTCKPGEERRVCSVCECNVTSGDTNETFNCTEECDFALCFECATLPHKVRYKHDKHILTLSYGEETSTMTYWCELCEGKINRTQRFYVCDENCCVTLHIECLLGWELYMKPGSHIVFRQEMIRILPNNHHMTRPICSICEDRCSQKVLFLYGTKICRLWHV